ncbi:glutamine-hydrolyzing GMP synthase [Candidatus Uhrbacteria bacterium]|nr:glutamine-hydrolyzing GMP synthase [Candidatus Uhrbacteria bacterium]
MEHNAAIHSQQCAILDAGAQYGKVIDRRVRELNVESVILPMDTPVTQLRDYRAIIISGGPQSVFGPAAPKYDPDLFTLETPMLGICYGMQLINYAHGGTVKTQTVREDGQYEITIDPSSQLFLNLDLKQQVLLTHGDNIEMVAEGFRVIGTSGALPTAIENARRKLYGVQFHPEVDLTTNGKQMLKNFLFGIAGFDGSFTVGNREEHAMREIRQHVGDKKALVLVSGGVDSTVCATLLTKALGADRVIAIHVDTGFMRRDESKNVKQALEAIGLLLRVVDASQTFYHATTVIGSEPTQPLNQVLAPEEKRKIIGNTYMHVVDEVMNDLGLVPNDVYLAQGTLRPDLIESASSLASGNADVIKTHHNDTQLVRQLRQQGRVLEPLKDYHKDEVRALGTLLGLPEALVWRQPFPGPGLAIRILCSDGSIDQGTLEKIQLELKAFETRDIRLFVLPVQSVGVQGDGRSYKYVVGVSGNVPWQQCAEFAKEIPKRVHGVNRVVRILGSAMGSFNATLTPTTLTPLVVQKLQVADDIVNQVVAEAGLMKKLSQVPVVLVPLSFGIADAHSIVLRPFITNDFMTGRPAIPGADLDESVVDAIVERVTTEVPGIARVLYDMTGKPPGTTEWE